jgi:hypothetical protein
MKNKLMIILCLPLILLILSAFSYADETYLSISPSPVYDEDKYLFSMRQGIYEFTVSGTRDVDISMSNIGFRMNYIVADNPPYGNAPSLEFYVNVIPGNPGIKSFEKKIKIYLPEGLFHLKLLVAENYSEYRVVDIQLGGRYLKTLGVDGYPVSVDISECSAKLNGKDSFTLDNLILPGYEGRYWGTFQWNPDDLLWELKHAGEE